ncbi:MAG: potassium transporter KtrA [Bacteroidetes bacterium]|nr:MAG: potassium transporter KtrA [Bacteroidota bacterium]
MVKSRFAVLGTGRYGTQIALSLAKRGAEVYTFDIKPERAEGLKEDVALAITLDSTDKKALKAQNVQDMEAAVVAIGENFEATVLTTLNLIDLKIPRIIVRANDYNQHRILKSLGVKEILSPESEVAAVVTERLINPSIRGFLRLPDEYEIAEIKAPPNCCGRTLKDISLGVRYGLRLITIRREFEEEIDGKTETTEHIIGVPQPETVIRETDTLVVFGALKSVNKFLDING